MAVRCTAVVAHYFGRNTGIMVGPLFSFFMISRSFSLSRKIVVLVAHFI